MSRARIALEELKRRNVFRAGIAYVVSAWLLVQIANVFLPALAAPDWIMQAILVLLALGLPATLALSWFYELTADGLKRTEAVPPNEPPRHALARRIDFVIIGILAGALSLSLYGNLRAPDSPPEPISILIADFDNGTGSDLFSGVLEETLRIGLEVAPFVDVFSRNTASSIAATLTEADTKSSRLDVDSASLVALRQGINIVIGGRVSRTNDGLTVSVSGIAPGERRELFAVSETADSDADVLEAIATVSRRVRVELGDTEKPGGAGELESFAVGNLEAAAEYLQAQDLQLNRDLEQAVVHYERALLHDPEFARAHAGLALTEQYLGRMDAASRHWEEALSRLDTLTERGQLRTLGNYYTIYQRDYENALRTYERLVEGYPADNVAQNNLAVAAFYALDFERALEVGRAIAARFPDHTGYRANLALYAMYAGHFDEAARVAEALIENDPSTVYAFVVLALTRAASGDHAGAENVYRRMTRLDSFGRAIAAEGLADLAIVRGDMAAAIEILDAAIEDELEQSANQSVALKQVMRAEALLQLDERAEALSAIGVALENAGGDPAVLVPAAIALSAIDETERAEAIAADMLRSSSTSQRAYAHAIRAQVAHVRGDRNAALEHANAAVDSADLWLVRFIRARILLESGQAAAAERDFDAVRQRIGEGLAVFLNDRPSLRRLNELETLAASIRRD